MSGDGGTGEAFARIMLRPIGAPVTLGLSGLGIASVVQSGLALGWIPARETIQVGLILIAVPFLLQLLACVFSYLARDGASGAAIGVLCGTWLALGLIHLDSGRRGPDAAAGLLLLSAGVALGASGATVTRSNLLAGCVFLLAGVRFGLEGIYQYGAGTPWQHASAVVGLLLAGVALYALVAFELEGQARRPLLPTFRRRRGRLALDSEMDGQRDDLTNEPGVRQGS